MAKDINIFISGANRGLGLEMVKQCLVKFKPRNIIATYRHLSSSEELQKIASENVCVSLVHLDLKDHTKFDEIASQIDKITNGTGLNLLINNSGIFTRGGQAFQDITKEMLMNYLEINTIGTILLTKAFLPLLEKAAQLASSKSVPNGIESAVIVNLSSNFGSISDNDLGGRYASRCCRAALNALTKNMSVDFISKNIMAFVMHPGWVQTEQGGPYAPLKSPESVEGMLAVFEKLGEEDNGKFFQYDGKVLNW